jgi:acetyl esterase/lipase
MQRAHIGLSGVSTVLQFQPMLAIDRTRVLAIAMVATSLGMVRESSAQQPISFDSLAAIAAPGPTQHIPYGTAQLQFGNLRLPKGRGPHPVVLFIHGGCYLSRYTIGHAAALEQALADSGYAVWSIEYRRVGDDGGGWPGTFQDVAAGADHLRVLAPKYSLDSNRVIAAGHSAGANFALWLATRQRLRHDCPLYSATPLKIGALLALAPATDLEGLHTQRVCGNVIDQLMGGSPQSVGDRYRTVSPTQLIPIGVPQVVIIGGQDRGWGPSGRVNQRAITAANDTLVRFVDAPAAGHFDIVAPTTSTWFLVVNSLRDLFRQLHK